jgi:hypothetical protein
MEIAFKNTFTVGPYILSQINPFHIPIPYSFRVHLVLSCQIFCLKYLHVFPLHYWPTFILPDPPRIVKANFKLLVKNIDFEATCSGC